MKQMKSTMNVSHPVRGFLKEKQPQLRPARQERMLLERGEGEQCALEGGYTPEKDSWAKEGPGHTTTMVRREGLRLGD